jgi:hypothetical protein
MRSSSTTRKAQIARQENMAIISANLTAAQIAANRDVTMSVLTASQQQELARVTAARDVQISEIAAGVQIQQVQAGVIANRDAAVISALPSLKKKNRDDVLKSLVTGDYGYQGPPGPGRLSLIRRWRG